MLQGYEVPNHSKEQPGDVKRGSKAEDGPMPGHVNHGDEEVLEVSVTGSDDSKNIKQSHL